MKIKGNQSHRIKVFLVELIITLFFFLIAIGLIMRINSYAQLLATRSAAQIEAIAKVESIGAYIKGSTSYEESLRFLDQFGNAEEEEKTAFSCTFYYDKNWQAVKTREESDFTLKLTRESLERDKKVGDLVKWQMQIKVEATGEVLYTVPISKCYLLEVENEA